MSTQFEATIRGVDGMDAVGRALAGRLIEGDVVLLVGGLAAGKTTLVKAVAAGLGTTDPVTSPTFALAQFYRAPAATLLHIDTYRLESVAEFRDLGLDEHLDSSITLIEWGQLVEGEFVDPLWIGIEHVPGDPDARVITVRGGGSRWSDAFPGLREEIAA